MQAESSQKSNIQFYQSISNILAIKDLSKDDCSVLYKAVYDISRYIEEQHVNLPALMVVLSDRHYRHLVSQAHYYFITESQQLEHNDLINNDNEETIKDIVAQLRKQIEIYKTNDIKKSSIKVLLKQVLMHSRFNKDSKLENNKVLTSDEYREIAFKSLDWLPVICEYSSRLLLADVFLHISSNFLMSAQQESEQNKKVASEALAFQWIYQAITLGKSASPDCEQYLLIKALSYINKFNFCDEGLGKIIQSLQKRSQLLLDIFPLLNKPISRLTMITMPPNTIVVMRSYLHYLHDVLKKESGSEQSSLLYDKAFVLYHIYEACLRNWYEGYNSSEVGEEVRADLMKSLLEQKGWSLNDVRKNVDSPWLLLNKDGDGWLTPQISVPIPEHRGIGKFRSVDSMEIDKKGGKITFNLVPSPSDDKDMFGVLSIFDILEMFDKNLTHGYLSLDQIDPNMPYHPFNKITFEPNRLVNTEFFKSMLITDYLLKFFTVGREVSSKRTFKTKDVKELISRLPLLLRDVIEDFHNSKSSEEVHRFWIEAEDAPVIIPENTLPTDEKLNISVGDVTMVVKKQMMVRDADGNLVDKDEDAEGWSIYVFDRKQLADLQESKITVKSPAIISIKRTEIVYFYEGKELSKAYEFFPYYEKLRDLQALKRDTDDQIIVKGQRSKVITRVYKATRYLTEQAKKFHHYSKEYIFAQEFTMKYNLFAMYFPEFARLRELSKISVLVRFIADLKQRVKHASLQLSELKSSSPQVRLVDEKGNPITSERLLSFARALSFFNLNDEEPDLGDKCFWVPANVNTSTKGCHFVYGGVKEQPMLNKLPVCSKEYRDLQGKSSSRGHIVVGSDELAKAREDSSRRQKGKSTVQLPTYLRLIDAAIAADRIHAARAAAQAADGGGAGSNTGAAPPPALGGSVWEW